jgi:hypothetical protein
MSAPAQHPICLTFTLDPEASQEVQRISEKVGISPDKLIGIALRWVSIGAEAEEKRRKVLVTSRAGYPIRELVIPR